MNGKTITLINSGDVQDAIKLCERQGASYTRLELKDPTPDSKDNIYLRCTNRDGSFLLSQLFTEGLYNALLAVDTEWWPDYS